MLKENYAIHESSVKKVKHKGKGYDLLRVGKKFGLIGENSNKINQESASALETGWGSSSFHQGSVINPKEHYALETELKLKGIDIVPKKFWFVDHKKKSYVIERKSNGSFFLLGESKFSKSTGMLQPPGEFVRVASEGWTKKDVELVPVAEAKEVVKAHKGLFPDLDFHAQI